MLRENQYTYAVTPHILSFTKEFKELFWAKHQAGAIPRQILENTAIPPTSWAKSGSRGIAHVIKKQYYSPKGLHEGPLPKAAQTAATDGKTTEKQIRHRQGKIQYLRLKIEFLKKFPRSEIQGSSYIADE